MNAVCSCHFIRCSLYCSGIGTLSECRPQANACASKAMPKRRSKGSQDDMPYAEAFFHFSQAYRKEVQPAQGIHRILRRSAQRSQKGKGNSSKGEGNFAPCHAREYGNSACHLPLFRSVKGSSQCRFPYFPIDIEMF